jgi:hypothetical protein
MKHITAIYTLPAVAVTIATGSIQHMRIQQSNSSDKGKGMIYTAALVSPCFTFLSNIEE